MEDGRGLDQPELVRCEVTDELVPADETVVIQGKRVGAHGKQILMDQLSTGHTVGGELEAPGSGRRFGCSFLDGIVIGIPVAILNGVATATLVTSAATFNARMLGAIGLIGTAIYMAYYTWMHAARGQTVGKIAGKIKVLNLDGSEISMGTSLVRAFMFAGIQAISPVLLLVGGEAMLGGLDGFGIYELSSFAVSAFVLANCITVLVSKDKRAIHDYVAGTRVVMLDA